MPDKTEEELAKQAEDNIEIWKIKKLIKSLEAARGNGTSMISLILPPKSQVAMAAKMLADEYGTASNIKSRVNRQSVLDAITLVDFFHSAVTDNPVFGIDFHAVEEEVKVPPGTHDARLRPARSDSYSLGDAVAPRSYSVS